MDCGEQCVTISGEHQMLKLCAVSWDYLQMVYQQCYSYNVHTHVPGHAHGVLLVRFL